MKKRCRKDTEETKRRKRDNMKKSKMKDTQEDKEEKER